MHPPRCPTDLSDAVRVSGKMARQLAGDDAVCAKNSLDRHLLRHFAQFGRSVQLRIVIVDVLGKMNRAVVGHDYRRDVQQDHPHRDVPRGTETACVADENPHRAGDHVSSLLLVRRVNVPVGPVGSPGQSFVRRVRARAALTAHRVADSESASQAAANLSVTDRSPDMARSTVSRAVAIAR